MREILYRLVQRLQEEARPLSRNKHFHVFVGEARRALRIDRHLRDLAQHLDLLRTRGEGPRVRFLPGGSVQLVLKHPTLAVVRTASPTPRSRWRGYAASRKARRWSTRSPKVPRDRRRRTSGRSENRFRNHTTTPPGATSPGGFVFGPTSSTRGSSGARRKRWRRRGAARASWESGASSGTARGSTQTKASRARRTRGRRRAPARSTTSSSRNIRRCNRPHPRQSQR